MADLPRTFAGDPNPPPKPPEAPAVSTAPAQGAPASGSPSSSEGASSGPDAAPPQDQAQPKALFRVVRNDAGGRDIYKLTDDGETNHWGQASNGDDVDAVLNAAAQYDPDTQSWDVPENVARSIADGRLSFPQEIAQGWAGGEAGVVRAYNGLNYLADPSKRDEVLARNHEATLKTQLGPDGRPAFAWNGLGKHVASAIASPVDTLVQAAKFALGSAASFGPMALEVTKGAVTGAAVAGGGAAGAALVTGTLELPPVAAGVALMFTTVGPLAGASKTLIDLETGGLAADMMEQGHDYKTIQQYAVVGGAIKGALWMTGFKFLPAPGKELVLGSLAKSELFQKAAGSWLLKYGSEVGGVTALGTAQEKIRQVLNNMAALAANKPELMISDEKGRDQLLNAAIAMAAGSAVIGLPGAAREGLKAREGAKAEAALRAETKAKLAERDAKAAEAPAAPAEVPKVEGAPKVEVKPPETVDPTGDYLPKDAAASEPVRALEAAVQPDAKAEPTDIVQKIDAALEAIDKADATKGKTFEEKLRDVEARAAQRKLEEDLSAVGQRIADKQREADRHERLGQPTKRLDTEIQDLLGKEQELKNGITFYEAAKGQAIVTPNEKLSMKPATLESITKLGFTEGRKEVLDVRRQKILDVAGKLDLTQGDLRTLMKDKNYGTMSDAEFNHWLSDGATKDGEHVPSFTERAAELKKRKVALEELRSVQKEKALKHADYARQLNDLPTVGKMTNEQIHDYADILRQYDKGDELMTPKRVRALEKTKFAGVKTWGEALKKTVSELGFSSPEEIFKSVDPGESDVFVPDAHQERRLPFRQEDPVKGFVVDRVKEVLVRSDIAAETVKRELHALAAEAVKERHAKMGAGARVMEWLAPQQRELRAYIEANKTSDYVGLDNVATEAAGKLTPSEKAYADLWIEFSRGALKYQERYDALASRFKDNNYFPHVARGFKEIIRDVASAPDVPKAFKAAVKEVGERFKRPAGEPTDALARSLGLVKHAGFEEFRSGKLEPSNNVFKVVDGYVHQFYTKVAADEVRPLVTTALEAFERVAKSPEDAQLINATTAFAEEYLRSKTGDARWKWAKGGKAEAALRFSMDVASWKYIAFNYALQGLAPVGEVTMAGMHLGNRGALKAVWRMVEDRLRSPQGERITNKYRNVFVSEGPVEALHPGSDVVDAAKAVAFGALRFHRKAVMEAVLLGSMTEAEFKAGEISPERLAQVKKEAGRWIDVHGNKSVRGMSVEGSSRTQFKGWAIPGAFSLAEDAVAIKDRVVLGKPLKPEVARDVYHLAQAAAVAALVRSWTSDEEDKDSFVGKAVHYLRGEVMSPFQGPQMVAMMVGGGVATELVTKLLTHIILLGQLEEFKTDTKDHNAGDLKGWDALMKDFSPKKSKEK